MHQWLDLHLQSTHNEQSLTFNAVALIFLYKDKIFPNSHLYCQLCLLHYNMTFSNKMENSLTSPCLGQIIHSVEQCCIENELLALHSSKVQDYGCPWVSSHHILYQPPNARNDLYSWWNHLSENDDCPGPRLWEGYALPWWRVWEWQLLWAPTPSYEAYSCLLSLNNWGLLWPEWIHHNPVPNFTLHSQMSQKPTILRRGPLTPNL